MGRHYASRAPEKPKARHEILFPGRVGPGTRHRNKSHGRAEIISDPIVFRIRLVVCGNPVVTSSRNQASRNAIRNCTKLSWHGLDHNGASMDTSGLRWPEARYLDHTEAVIRSVDETSRANDG